MNKLIACMEDPRRLWKAQLAAVALTVVWILLANLETLAAREERPPERGKTEWVSTVAPAALPPETDPRGIPPLPVPAMPERETPVAPVEQDDAPALEPAYYDVPLSEDLQDYIRELCGEYAVPMPLILSIIEVESDFDPSVVSTTDDYGLMQVNRCNFEDCRAKFGDVDFLDPWDNLRCGVWLFAAEYHAEDGNAVRALMRYNNGPTGARRKWAQGIRETAYTRKVVAAMEKWEEV